MTLEQEIKILMMYRKDIPYKVISIEVGLPISTIASFLRRKHQNLKRLKTIQKKQEIERFTKHFQKLYNLTETQARAMYEGSLARFKTKRSNCIQRGIEFSIQFSEIEFPAICPILGIPLDYWAEHCRADTYPTFDRTDNSKGYVSGNVAVVSWRANRLKNDGTADEHRLIAAYLESAEGPKPEADIEELESPSKGA